jgi:hypothetical protein
LYVIDCVTSEPTAAVFNPPAGKYVIEERYELELPAFATFVVKSRNEPCVYCTTRPDGYPTDSSAPLGW